MTAKTTPKRRRATHIPATLDEFMLFWRDPLQVYDAAPAKTQRRVLALMAEHKADQALDLLAGYNFKSVLAALFAQGIRRHVSRRLSPAQLYLLAAWRDMTANQHAAQ